MNPKISIITVCQNNVNTIEYTIHSVIGQTYKSIEYIIIDGKSTDGTLEIIHKYGDNIHTLISEKDAGIYDAMNKGIRQATGEYIAFLHADDFYANSEVISKAMTLLQKSGADAIYGDLQYVDKTNAKKVKRHWKAGQYKKNSFLFGWMPPHPTFIAKASIYKQYGGFNLQFQSAADYEIMLRFIHKEKIRLGYLPEVMVMMRTGGKSNASIGNRIFANKEDKKAWHINHLKPYWFTTILKPLRKISQWQILS